MKACLCFLWAWVSHDWPWNSGTTWNKSKKSGRHRCLIDKWLNCGALFSTTHTHHRHRHIIYITTAAPIAPKCYICDLLPNRNNASYCAWAAPKHWARPGRVHFHAKLAESGSFANSLGFVDDLVLEISGVAAVVYSYASPAFWCIYGDNGRPY